MKKVRLKEKYCVVCGDEVEKGRLITCSDECGRIEARRRDREAHKKNRGKVQREFIMNAF